jgi:hypothetical protein
LDLSLDFNRSGEDTARRVGRRRHDLLEDIQHRLGGASNALYAGIMIQGPFMIDAANAISASPAQTAMSVMLGNAWNDLVQPFWILPALALSKLKLKDIMGYTVIMRFWVGIVYIAAILLWGFLA